MSILHTTHNHVHSTQTYRIRNPSAPPFLRVSHSQNSSYRHSTRTSPASGNPSPPTFYPGVSLPKSLCVAISSGCLTPEIPLCRHFIQVSHSRNPSAPPFHPGVSLPESFYAAIPPGVSLPEFLSVAIPSWCITPGIPLRRRPTFSFIPRAFSLGSKITFLIKFCCRFPF